MVESVKNHQLNKQKFGKPPTSFPYELGDGEIDQLGNTFAKFVIHSYQRKRLNMKPKDQPPNWSSSVT